MNRTYRKYERYISLLIKLNYLSYKHDVDGCTVQIAYDGMHAGEYTSRRRGRSNPAFPKILGFTTLSARQSIHHNVSALARKK